MLAASGLEDPALVEMLNELETSRMDELMRLQVHVVLCCVRAVLNYDVLCQPFSLLPFLLFCSYLHISPFPFQFKVKRNSRLELNFIG